MATYNEGYYEQTTYDQEATLTTLKYLGIPLENKKPIIQFGNTEEITEREVYGSYSASLEAGNQIMNQVSAAFIPTNARFLWWMLGKRTASSGVRTITHMDGSAYKPRLSLWKQANNSKRHVYGVVFENMNLMWQSNRLRVSLIGKGMGHGSDAFTPSIAWDGTISNPWSHISAISWNSGSLTPYALSLQMRQPCVGFIGYNGHFQHISEFTTIKGAYNLVVSGANGESMLADYDSKTARTFSWQVKKTDADSDKYMTFTSTCRIAQINVTDEIGKEPIYNVLLFTEAVSAEVKDGL